MRTIADWMVLRRPPVCALYIMQLSFGMELSGAQAAGLWLPEFLSGSPAAPRRNQKSDRKDDCRGRYAGADDAGRRDTSIGLDCQQIAHPQFILRPDFLRMRGFIGGMFILSSLHVDLRLGFGAGAEASPICTARLKKTCRQEPTSQLAR